LVGLLALCALLPLLLLLLALLVQPLGKVLAAAQLLGLSLVLLGA
jgi:hypothetical protein